MNLFLQGFNLATTFKNVNLSSLSSSKAVILILIFIKQRILPSFPQCKATMSKIHVRLFTFFCLFFNVVQEGHSSSNNQFSYTGQSQNQSTSHVVVMTGWEDFSSLPFFLLPFFLFSVSCLLSFPTSFPFLLLSHLSSFLLSFLCSLKLCTECDHDSATI